MDPFFAATHKPIDNGTKVRVSGYTYTVVWYMADTDAYGVKRRGEYRSMHASRIGYQPK